MNDSADVPVAAPEHESEATHSAAVTWEGPLIGGGGRGAVTLDSVAAPAMPLTWESRTEPPGGRTSPEELISAGLASCFSMMLAHLLAQQGHPPTRIHTEARAAKRIGGNFAIKRIELHVQGEVDGLDEQGFQATAALARRDCPAANALTGTEIQLTVALM